MNEDERALLSMYMQQRRIKIIVISIIVLLVLIFGGIYLYAYREKMTIPSEEIEEVNEIDINIEETSIGENILEEEIVADQPTETKVIEEQTNQDATPKKSVENNNQTTTQSNNDSSQTGQQETSQKTKPPNKDFLFKVGYTMDNVTMYATAYLGDHAGECVPLKDDEGVYIGMRVIFY